MASPRYLTHGGVIPLELLLIVVNPLYNHVSHVSIKELVLNVTGESPVQFKKSKTSLVAFISSGQ